MVVVSGGRVATASLTSRTLCVGTPLTAVIKYPMRSPARSPASAVGFGSDALYIPATGTGRWIEQQELFFAEDHMQFVDEFIASGVHILMGLHSRETIEKLADHLRSLLVNHANALRESVKFSGLESMQ